MERVTPENQSVIYLDEFAKQSMLQQLQVTYLECSEMLLDRGIVPAGYMKIENTAERIVVEPMGVAGVYRHGPPADWLIMYTIKPRNEEPAYVTAFTMQREASGIALEVFKLRGDTASMTDEIALQRRYGTAQLTAYDYNQLVHIFRTFRATVWRVV